VSGGMSFQHFQDSEKKLATFRDIAQTWRIVPNSPVLGARASKLPLLKFSQAYQEVKAALEYILEEQQSQSATIEDVRRQLNTKWDFPKGILWQIFKDRRKKPPPKHPSVSGSTNPVSGSTNPVRALETVDVEIFAQDAVTYTSASLVAAITSAAAARGDGIQINFVTVQAGAAIQSGSSMYGSGGGNARGTGGNLQ
jgi:hypothetical protein